MPPLPARSKQEIASHPRVTVTYLSKRAQLCREIIRFYLPLCFSATFLVPSWPLSTFWAPSSATFLALFPRSSRPLLFECRGPSAAIFVPVRLRPSWPLLCNFLSLSLLLFAFSCVFCLFLRSLPFPAFFLASSLRLFWFYPCDRPGMSW